MRYVYFFVWSIFWLLLFDGDNGHDAQGQISSRTKIAMADNVYEIIAILLEVLFDAVARPRISNQTHSKSSP